MAAIVVEVEGASIGESVIGGKEDNGEETHS